MFDQNFFTIEAFYGFTQPQHMKLEFASMWLQLHNLLLNGMHKKCGKQLGESNGELGDIDVEEDNVG